MRIAATADLHFTPQSYSVLQEQFAKVRDEADLLILAGDLTNFGKASEVEPLIGALIRLQVPIVVVLGNHDYESGEQSQIAKTLTAEGIQVLDGSAFEKDGIGFAGTKGFLGGFGRGMLTAFGEPEVKAFVRASIDESVKLERAMSQLRTSKRIVVLHYSPILETVCGEVPEIYPFLGTSRLAEVIDRHGADLVVHGHAHHGRLDGKTIGGVPVHNVAITLLQSSQPSRVYRVFEV